MTHTLLHGNALHVSELLEPGSVDLLVTSPPYFALRSYRDDGEHYDGQLGSEASPTEFVDALIACTRDWMKVMRPGGSIFVNLGDKMSGSGGHNNGIGRPSRASMFPNVDGSQGWGQRDGKHAAERSAAEQHTATRRNAPDRYNQNADGIPRKSLMGLPWRYALRCIDELGLTLRAEIIWSKPNGLPESVTDRVRRSHEQWFHFTLGPTYFAAIDEVREAHAQRTLDQYEIEKRHAPDRKFNPNRQDGGDQPGLDANPLGKVPSSVWTIPSEPLVVPDDLGVDHFAAFPSEWPRRIILGWSPSGYCTACGEPRRAVVEKGGLTDEGVALANRRNPPNPDTYEAAGVWGAQTENYATMRRLSGPEIAEHSTPRSITGYVCACPDTDAPTRPAVVLDPFCGTGTTPAVASLLGRHGIGIDLSRDYLRLAEWRCTSDRRLRDKVLDRTGIPNPKPPVIDGQTSIFDAIEETSVTRKPPHNPPIRWRDGADPRTNGGAA